MIQNDLLEILACPACDARPKVTLDGDRLVCASCGRRYPIRDDIPVMLVEEAESPRGVISPSAQSPPPPPGGAANASAPSKAHG